MDPMSRKMFKSRDARNTLRGMGGIMASSPELSQTVQQFQEGGAVHAPSGMPYADMSRMQLQVLARTGDEIALNMLREEVPVAAQPDASPIQRFPPAPADLRDDAKAERSFGRSAYMSGLQTPSDLRPMFSARAETPLSEMSPERLEAERMAVESGGVKELGTDIVEVVTGAVRGVGESLQQGLGSGLSIMGMPGAGAFSNIDPEFLDSA